MPIRSHGLPLHGERGHKGGRASGSRYRYARSRCCGCGTCQRVNGIGGWGAPPHTSAPRRQASGHHPPRRRPAPGPRPGIRSAGRPDPLTPLSPDTRPGPLADHAASARFRPTCPNTCYASLFPASPCASTAGVRQRGTAQGRRDQATCGGHRAGRRPEGGNRAGGPSHTRSRFPWNGPPLPPPGRQSPPIAALWGFSPLPGHRRQVSRIN